MQKYKHAKKYKNTKIRQYKNRKMQQQNNIKIEKYKHKKTQKSSHLIRGMWGQFVENGNLSTEHFSYRSDSWRSSRSSHALGNKIGPIQIQCFWKQS